MPSTVTGSRSAGNTAAACAVNAACVRQYQRRLRQRSRTVRPATGRSRGRVVVHCFTRIARCPHVGQHRACSEPVDRSTTGTPAASSSTLSATRPSTPSSRVVSLTVLAALHL